MWLRCKYKIIIEFQRNLSLMNLFCLNLFPSFAEKRFISISPVIIHFAVLFLDHLQLITKNTSEYWVLFWFHVFGLVVLVIPSKVIKEKPTTRQLAMKERNKKIKTGKTSIGSI